MSTILILTQVRAHLELLMDHGSVIRLVECSANTLANRYYIESRICHTKKCSLSEEEESDSDDGMCEPGTHVWRNILCMICFFCGECTGYGPGCCRNGEPGRDPGL